MKPHIKPHGVHSFVIINGFCKSFDYDIRDLSKHWHSIVRLLTRKAEQETAELKRLGIER